MRPWRAITGLVGPNGAGKTTTFNVCSGLVKPTDGQVVLHGRDVTSLGSAERSRLGLGRSFQRVELFSSLTVRENMALGREASMAGANPVRQLVSSAAQRAVVHRAVGDAIELTGIGPLAHLQAGLLPDRPTPDGRAGAGAGGTVRHVAAGRAVVRPRQCRDQDASARSSPLRSAERGLGILLVEHDMALVRQICRNIYVLDFGQLIFEGSPAEMLASPVVRGAYLGSEGVDGPPAGPDRSVGVRGA